jgi:small subunit ribosomal protein S1
MNERSIDRDDEEAAADFGKALEEFERGGKQGMDSAPEAVEPVVGARVRGRVVALTSEHALVDIGARSEAIVDLSHFRTGEEAPRIAVGDAVELFVIEAADPAVLAPSMRSDSHAGLSALRDAQRAGMPVGGRVLEANTGGLRVDLGGAKGFCPLSQIEIGFCSNPSAYVGRTLEFLVTGIEEGRRSVTLSRRQLLQRKEKEEAERRVRDLAVGQEIEGTVRHLESFGAFVDLGGVEGMVHVSEIQHARIAHPKDALVEGQKVKVRVLRVESTSSGRPRIGLSIKAAAPDPWNGIESRIVPGTRVHGVVARIAEFGAFVTLEPGVDGLVHISEVAPRRIERVKEVLAVGQEVEAMVLAVDVAKKRISLSIKATAEGAPTPEPRTARKPEAVKPKEAPRPATTSDEPTTMALAFRKAAEKARQKQAQRGE